MTHANAMSDLCALMLQQKLDAFTFAEWVNWHYGDPGAVGSVELARWVAKNHPEPHPLDSLRVLEFDAFLRRRDVQDCEFTRAMIELRNVFARHANMAMPATVALGAENPAPVAPQRAPPPKLQVNPEASVAEVFARLLCSVPG